MKIILEARNGTRLTIEDSIATQAEIKLDGTWHTLKSIPDEMATALLEVAKDDIKSSMSAHYLFPFLER